MSTDVVDSLLQKLDQCMLIDRGRLRRRIRQLADAGPGESGRRRGRGRRGRMARGGRGGDSLADIERDMAASIEQAALRQAALPVPSFPEELPVVRMKSEIAEAIAKHQVIVLCGDTGSGKTTQLPKICLELGRGVKGMIGHTQPRRIAARSVAARLATELRSSVGQTVGYKIRFIDELSETTYIKLMTDGIMLAEIPQDRLLLKYDTIIIDEAHERSLNIDFLLGYLHQLLPKRPDLKVIITSATIDPDRFSRHFHNAPIIMVEGRTYPVELRYRPLADEDDDEREVELLEGITRAVDELSRAGKGDILIFFPTERDIREAADELRKRVRGGTEILPLFARLSSEEQMRVFQPHGGRRIVLATNVAETSLTVPGIRYVIDTGLARISRYSPRNRVQRLPIEPISRASADQRKGRCGRVAEGICIRLYGEEEYEKRAQYTDPEIQRTNLASVILQMKAMGFGDIDKFPFLDPPDRRTIRDGYDTLTELGALTSAGELTQIGRDLSRLPIDPRLGRMILASVHEKCLDDVLIIAAALAVQDPRERPIDKAAEADEAHAKHRDESSDFVTLMNLWNWYFRETRGLSHSRTRKLCQQNFVSYFRMREWIEVHKQLGHLVRTSGILTRASSAYAPVETQEIEDDSIVDEE